MKKLLLSLAFISLISFVNAQYSNATLNGPWFMDSNPAHIYSDDSTNYLVFDGNGNITDCSMFVGTFTGTYSVTTAGAISGTLVIGGSTTFPLSAQLTSQNYAPMTSGGMALSRISNPGALTDSLVGLLYTASCGQKNVTLRLNNQGQIISASGLASPVTGRVYADSGHFEGHIKTGETTGGWNEFTIMGAYANDSLIGKIGLNESGCGVETTHLKRFGHVTDIVPIVVSAPKLIIYPNPAANIIILNINNKNNSDFTLNIYNEIGELVKSKMMKQNNRQINISDLNNGIYLLEIKSDNYIAKQKLIIQR